MKWEVSIEPTTEEDLEDLISEIRSEDLNEITAAGIVDLRESVTFSYKKSYECMTGRIDGKLVVVFGIGRTHALSQDAIPWLLGTDLIEKYGFVFAKRSREIVRLWRSRHPLMRNFVHADNHVSIRWLKWLGFSLKDKVTIGPNNAVFYPFEMRG